jgi:perosamine synthetase
MGIIKLPKKSIEFFNKNYSNIFDSGNLAEGDWSKKVAQWACNYTSANYSLAVNSNGSGMYAILRLWKQYKQKKRIFLQSNTMYGVKTIAISSGLEMCGFVDCSLDYLMPTYEQVCDFVNHLHNPEECVFLLTHIGGWINPDIDKIAELCCKQGILLLEDCAHSLGSTLKGQHSGTFGDAGVYSLYATKTVPVGEGGIIITNDQELYHMVEKFIMYDRFDQELNVGVNLRMSEINALLTYAVINETESIIENKYKIAKKYIEACEKNNWEYIKPISNDQRSNLYKFIILSNSDNPEQEFSKIKTRTSPVYNYALGTDPFQLARRHICLPIWYLLEDENIEISITELRK